MEGSAVEKIEFLCFGEGQKGEKTGKADRSTCHLEHKLDLKYPVKNCEPNHITNLCIRKFVVYFEIKIRQCQ